MPNISYQITVKRSADQTNPPWVYQCNHPNDKAVHPAATWDRSVAESAARKHATNAHPVDEADVIVEGD